MKNTRAILAAALLTGLQPVAAYSQGTRAPADAFIYIIWPPDGTTVKGAFWCRFGLRNMGVTQTGSNAPNSGHHHLLIDVNEPLDPNEPIPQDKTSLRMTARQTEPLEKLCNAKQPLNAAAVRPKSSEARNRHF